MKKQHVRITVALAVLALGYGAWYLWGGSGLVTLNVRDAEVRDVVRKIERQTRQTILLDSNVTGKVTFKVRRAPLESVLTIIDDQISARWSTVYPLYSGGKSFTAFQQSLRNEINPIEHGWTNLNSRGSSGGFGGRGGPGGGPGGPGADSRDPNRRISLTIEGKTVQFATLSLNRFAQTRVVPEDGTDGLVMLKLDKAKVDEAVARLAKQAKRDWAKVYLLQGSERGRGGEFASRDGGGRGDRGTDDGGRRGRPDWTSMTDEQRDQLRAERESLEKELAQTLPATEQAKLAEEQQKRDQMRQEFATMTDEQRRAQFEQMRGGGGRGGGGGGTRDQRMLERIKNTTPEQKVERYREMAARRARWEQGQQGGRGSGPGRGR